MTTVRAWIIEETTQALLLSNHPPERDGKQMWIPRSCCDRITKEAPLANGWRPAEVKVSSGVLERKEWM